MYIRQEYVGVPDVWKLLHGITAAQGTGSVELLPIL